MITKYHVFWDYNDEWFDDKAEAYAVYQALSNEIRKRLYTEEYANKADYEYDIIATEQCLESNGEYPL